MARDGTVRVYGDGDDPERLCYRFRRSVDFAAAACLLIRHSAFDSLGGFDDRYAPAYYEDTDLAVRLARLGLWIMYEPRSSVTHVRYGSTGKDRASDLSEVHRHLFAERWGAELVGRPWTFDGMSDQALIAARDAVATPRVLICSGPDEVAVKPVVGLLLQNWPRARVTWTTRARRTDAFKPDEWLEAGVELADEGPPEWLESRLFHYDLVLLGVHVHAQMLDALERTQPQALRTSLTAFENVIGMRSAIEALLATAGIAPPARSDR
jgi:hypothetical protein